MLTLERAIADNTTADSLRSVAEWNEHPGHGRGTRRHKEQARHLREIARQVDGLSGHRAAYREGWKEAA